MKLERAAQERKVGFFSGTFDPVHMGHIAFALEAANVYGLDKILILPEEYPRQKKNVTKLQHRLAMLETSIKDFPQLEIFIPQEKTFHVKSTLPELQHKEPNAQLVYLCGSDVVKTFAYRWEGLDDLLQTAEIIVGMRTYETTQEVIKVLTSLHATKDWRIIGSPKLHLASTTIRNGKHTITDIHPNVAAYIKQHKLYS